MNNEGECLFFSFGGIYIYFFFPFRAAVVEFYVVIQFLLDILLIILIKVMLKS